MISELSTSIARRAAALRRGRAPVLTWLGPVEVARVLGVHVDRVPAMVKDGFFPGARVCTESEGRLRAGQGVSGLLGDWLVPVSDLLDLLRVDRLQNWVSFPRLARLIGCSVRTLERWRDARPRPLLLCREIRNGECSLGWRVPESEYWRLVGVAGDVAALGRERSLALRLAGDEQAGSMDHDVGEDE